MLKQKFSKCVGCGFDRPIWKDGKCQSCSRSSYGVIKGRSDITLKYEGQLKMGSPLKKTRKGKSKEVRDFYRRLAEDLMFSAVSIETGIGIPNPSAMNMAHIFPKDSYPSVATNPKNIVMMTWEEHTRFDELLGSHEFEKLAIEFPNSWGKICGIVWALLPEVTERKPLRIKLEKYLNDL